MPDFSLLKYLVIDIDGTMTDGGIYYDEHGNELKKFCTKDAAGFFAAHHLGIKIIVITGRKCLATQRRLSELKVDYIFQNVKGKKLFLENFMQKEHITSEQLGYLGDDLNDLPAMALASFIACPADSCKEVKEIAHYVSPIKGGYGAVRDIIEFMLRSSEKWNDAVKNVYGLGI